MRAYLGGLLLLLLAVLLQSAVVTQWHLLRGTVDLPLLVLAAWVTRERRVAPAWFWGLAIGALWDVFSALPPGTGIIAYGSVGLAAQILRQRLWHPPYLLLFLLLLGGSLETQGVAYAMARLALAADIPFVDAIVQVMLPTLLLNLLAALPVYAVVVEWADWVLPTEEGVGG